jgi:hypothetical protein
MLMSLYAPGPPASPSAQTRRKEHVAQLILTELDPLAVVDAIPDAGQRVDLITFGSTREVCPKCRQGGLKLVLRQSSVRVAHLFCADCTSCYDARYPDGAPALTI